MSSSTSNTPPRTSHRLSSKRRVAQVELTTVVSRNKRRKLLLPSPPSSPKNSRRRGKENAPVQEQQESEDEYATAPESEGAVEEASERSQSPPSFEETAEPEEQIVEKEDEKSDEEVEEDLEDAARSYPTPNTTPTKIQDSRPSSIYTRAKQLLSTSSILPSDTPFVSRSKEEGEIRSFLTSRLHSQSYEDTAPSLYISGLPGLGKTALLSHILRDFSSSSSDSESSVQVHMENCSTLPASMVSGGAGLGSKTFWERLAKGLDVQLGANGGYEAFAKALREDGTERKFLLVLDEVDALLPTSATSTSNATSSSSRTSLLQTLFLLSASTSNSFTLIGIANSLDLTTRHLSLAPSQAPTLIHFEPYKATGIGEIVRQRLMLLDVGVGSEEGEGEKLVEKSALMLFSRRVENVDGDLRLAFGIIRKAISIVESRVRAKLIAEDASTPLSTNDDDQDEAQDLDDPLKKLSNVDFRLASLTIDQLEPVKIPDVLAAFRGAGIIQNDPLANQISGLSLNPRLVLVGVLIALASSTSSTPGAGKSGVDKGKGKMTAQDEKKEITTSEAFAFYRAMLKWPGIGGGSMGLRILNQAEYSSTLDILSSEALLSVYTPSNSPSKNKGRKSFGSITNPSIAFPLSSSYTKSELIEALKTVPGKSEDGTASGIGVELMRISKNLFGEEERRKGRELKSAEREKDREEVMKMVPRGWERENEEWLGKKVR